MNNLDFDYSNRADIDLSMFYHPKTEAEIISLRNYLIERKRENNEDNLDRWIRMVSTNRLTGHSTGFFSVYTLPPNQAILPERQISINKKRNQKPDYRKITERILRKTKTLLQNVSQVEKENLILAGKTVKFLTKDARETLKIENESVNLVVTSPPFLDVVQYSKDNWLRCWFNNIDVDEIENKITMTKKLDDWCDVMSDVFRELYRITKKGGYVAFEVGEVRKGKIKLDEYVVPLGVNTGFEPLGIIINLQEFTKTANIWGINNLEKGTNTNRIVLFQK